MRREITPAYALGAILLFLGWLYALLPHAYHEAAPLPYREEHGLHTLLGVALAVLGVLVLVWDARRAKVAARRPRRKRRGR
jgi:hypothetical protein